jgi:hypothetical protein
MRVVGAGKSKYYHSAAANIERACKCYLRAGLAAEWEETDRLLRVDHYRKTAFTAAFESVAAGTEYQEPLSFLERAKARWGGKGGRVRS